MCVTNLNFAREGGGESVDIHRSFCNHVIASLAYTRVPVRQKVSLPLVGLYLDRARTPESKVRVWSRSLDPIDSIG